MISLKLLRDITARGAIPNVKRVFQSLSAACLEVLDKSDNVVLLTTVMGFVKDWLLNEPLLPASPSLSDQVCVVFRGRWGWWGVSYVVVFVSCFVFVCL